MTPPHGGPAARQRARRDPRATREAIVKAAGALFARKGYHGTNLGEIARRAGVAKSLIHHHFGSKEGLYLAVVERFTESYARRFRQEMEEPLEVGGSVEEGFQAYFRLLAETPDSVRMGTWLSLFLNEEPRRVEALECSPGPGREDVRYLHEVAARLVERFARLQQEGRMRPELDPAMVLAAIWCLTEHWHEARRLFAVRLRQGMEGPDADRRYLETAVEIFLRGIEPRDHTGETP